MVNWLIRTKNGQILGPLSRKKVCDLYANGMLKAEDELAFGNGYWIQVREKDLLNTLLLQGEVESFMHIPDDDTHTRDGVKPDTDIIDLQGLDAPSPQPEVKFPHKKERVFHHQGEQYVLPRDEDLEYPQEQKKEKKVEVLHPQVQTMDSAPRQQRKEAYSEGIQEIMASRKVAKKSYLVMALVFFIIAAVFYFLR